MKRRNGSYKEATESFENPNPKSQNFHIYCKQVMEADELIELMRQPFSSYLNIMALLDANCDFPATTGRDVIMLLL